MPEVEEGDPAVEGGEGRVHVGLRLRACRPFFVGQGLPAFVAEAFQGPLQDGNRGRGPAGAEGIGQDTDGERRP